MPESRPFLLDDRLDSWKEIASYLSRDVRTVQRWEKNAGLPVHRLKIEKAGSVYAYKSELDAWWNERRPVLEPQAAEEKQSRRLIDWAAVRKYRLGAAAGAAIIVLMIGWAFNSTRRSFSSRVSRVKVTHKQVTFLGNAYAPGISPDGTYVAFVSRKYGEDDRLMVQASNGATQEVAHGEDVRDPRWSPDGSELLFFRNEATKKVGGTFVVSPLGGVARQISDARYACWLGPDGSQIVVASESEASGFKGVRLVNALTGESKEIPLPQYVWLLDIDCSPRTGLILAVTGAADRCEILVFNSGGSGQFKAVEEHERIYAARWSPTGDSIYYLHGNTSTGTLSKFSVTGRKTESVALSSGLQFGFSFSVSADGARLIYTRLNSSSNLWRIKWRPNEGAAKPEISELTSGTFSHAEPSYSPNGRWISFRRGPDFDTTNIFKMPVEGGTFIQLTFFEPGTAVSPAWSPDGQRIAFVGYQNGVSKVWTVGANGGDLKILEKTNATNANGYIVWWPSHDIVYQQPENWNYLQIDGETGEEIRVLRSVPANGSVPFRPVFSPDGKRMAFFWNRKEPGTWIVSRSPYSETLLKPGEFYPIGWSPDGKFIYGIPKAHGRQIVRVQLAEPHAETLVADLPGPITGFDNAAVSPDGLEIVISIREEKSDVWSMENFDLAAARAGLRPN
jgi:Tol biopolymer transport system component